jgi:hypothetical protein
MWKYSNPNPCRQEEPDCVVRAIAIATDQPWDAVHLDLCILSNIKCTMPSVNWLWGLYLKQHGFEKHSLPDTCPECTTVREFTKMYPRGTYVVCTGSHAVCVDSGDYIDAWDSGDEIVSYYYRKKG